MISKKNLLEFIDITELDDISDKLSIRNSDEQNLFEVIKYLIQEGGLKNNTPLSLFFNDLQYFNYTYEDFELDKQHVIKFLQPFKHCKFVYNNEHNSDNGIFASAVHWYITYSDCEDRCIIDEYQGKCDDYNYSVALYKIGDIYVLCSFINEGEIVKVMVGFNEDIGMNTSLLIGENYKLNKNKKALYESIMKAVSKEIKKALNENI